MTGKLTLIEAWQTRDGHIVALNDQLLAIEDLQQFVAAMNVSNNLHIDFGQLKAAMTGTTLAGTPTATGTTSSLGQAIQQLRPTADADAEDAVETEKSN